MVRTRRCWAMGGDVMEGVGSITCRRPVFYLAAWQYGKASTCILELRWLLSLSCKLLKSFEDEAEGQYIIIRPPPGLSMRLNLKRRWKHSDPSECWVKEVQVRHTGTI